MAKVTVAEPQPERELESLTKMYEGTLPRELVEDVYRGHNGNFLQTLRSLGVLAEESGPKAPSLPQAAVKISKDAAAGAAAAARIPAVESEPGTLSPWLGTASLRYAAWGAADYEAEDPIERPSDEFLDQDAWVVVTQHAGKPRGPAKEPKTEADSSAAELVSELFAHVTLELAEVLLKENDGSVEKVLDMLFALSAQEAEPLDEKDPAAEVVDIDIDADPALAEREAQMAVDEAASLLCSLFPAIEVDFVCRVLEDNSGDMDAAFEYLYPLQEAQSTKSKRQQRPQQQKRTQATASDTVGANQWGAALTLAGREKLGVLQKKFSAVPADVVLAVFQQNGERVRETEVALQQIVLNPLLASQARRRESAPRNAPTEISAPDAEFPSLPQRGASPKHKKKSEWTDAVACDLKLSKLGALFPHLDHALLLDVFHSCNKRIDKTVATLAQMDPLVAKKTAPLPKPPPPQSAVPAPKPLRLPPVDASHPARVPLSTETLNAFRSHSSRVGATTSKQQEIYEHYRQEAVRHGMVRNLHFREAARAHLFGVGASARSLANEGYKANQQLREANEKAAQALVAMRARPGNQSHRNAATSSLTLDLHGMTVSNALDFLEVVLRLLTDSLRPDETVIVSVVTGVGKHSANGIAKLRPAVQDYLASSLIPFVDKGGYFLIRLVKSQRYS